jgi:hypothetical protein
MTLPFSFCIVHIYNKIPPILSFDQSPPEQLEAIDVT